MISYFFWTVATYIVIGDIILFVGMLTRPWPGLHVAVTCVFMWPYIVYIEIRRRL